MKASFLAFFLGIAALTATTAKANPLAGIEQAEDRRDAKAPALIEALASESPAIRARAALAWGRIQKPESVEPLLKLLADPFPEVQLEAVFALGQLGWVAGAAGGKEVEIASKMQALLTSPQESARLYAAEALGKIGRLQTPALLLPAFEDPSPAVRAAVVFAMFRYRLVERLLSTATPPPTLADLPQEAMAKLLALRQDPDPRVRRNVAYYFARVKDARGMDAIQALSKDRDPEVRAFAVMALGKQEDVKGAIAAKDAAWDSELPVRLAAVQSLAALKMGELAPAQLEHDPSFHVRAALASATPDEALLERLLKDKSPEVQAAALTALAARRKADALALLETALAAPSSLLRATAIEAAAGIPEAANLVKKALTDQDELVRATALGALAATEGPEALTALEKALSATGIAERGTAAEALRERKEPQAVTLAWAAYQASAEPKFIEIRETLVDILASKEKEAPAIEDYLRQALLDPAPSVAAKAKEALLAKGVTGLPEIQPPPASVTPHHALRFAKPPVVLIETNKGSFKVECFSEDAPVHVANFVGLVKSGFYDGLLWHRVVPNFVVQGGDPLGTGWGDAGYTVRAEINRQPFLRGALGMPRGQGFDTGSCQLFFSLIPTPHLDGQYTVFGQIRDGIEIIDQLERGDRIVKASVFE